MIHFYTTYHYQKLLVYDQPVAHLIIANMKCMYFKMPDERIYAKLLPLLMQSATNLVEQLYIINVYDSNIIEFVLSQFSETQIQ